jgi:alkylresorcinol/alkylpyrone synthase
MIPRLAALATAVPPFALDQDRVTALMQRMFPRSARFERLRPVFANSGIDRRYSAMPLDWFEEPHSWPERNRAYIAAALDLLETVAGRLLDRAEASLDEVGAVVTVSTTGIATPSLDALLIERLRLPRDVQRLPIFGLGCAGGAIGLGKAATLARSCPDRAVLLLVVELCTLAFHRDDGSSDIVAAALFGDGAAGALLRCTGAGPAIVASGEHTWPASLDVMGWDIVDEGFKAIFSRDIPTLVVDGLGAAARDFLARHGLQPGDIDRFVCHPGGPKVIAACETALGIPESSLEDARAVLREFGNMSAPSVLFVLERMMAAGGDWRRALVTALGPGFTAGFTMLSRE